MSALAVSFHQTSFPRPIAWIEERYSQRCRVKKTIRQDSPEDVVIEYESASPAGSLEVRPCFDEPSGENSVEPLQVDLVDGGDVIVRHGERTVRFASNAARIEVGGDDPSRPFVAVFDLASTGRAAMRMTPATV